MKKYLILLVFGLVSCGQGNQNSEYSNLALEVKNEMLRSWNSYQEYAWGHDALKPLSKSYDDWYSEPLYISPIDAYSSLKLMGFDNEAKEIEEYVINELSWEKDIDAKIFEVNIRILGGLLAMYEQTENKQILDKTVDFANRMMPAFNTKTGIPTYWVNLKTGVAHGDTVNVAEAATYTFEMGILSYYTGNPIYYQAAKKATLAIYERRSEIGLIGSVIDVQTGEWISEDSHICAGVDSYYEYLYKSFVLFGDSELGEIWDESIKGIHTYLSDEVDGRLWFGRANMYTGNKSGSSAARVTLYDAFFPATLALSGDIATAERYHASWDWLWNQYGLEPMVYDYRENKLGYPAYDLNPEIIESAYYLRHFTKDKIYLEKAKQYWSDIKEYCATDVAFASVEDVRTMEKKDYMPTFFFAETLKYLYLIFSDPAEFNFDDHMFNTEAHQFKISSFDKDEFKVRLGIE
jgi:mannosidase alpha-like ER degradation enhancer 1/mannosidase alpha-like ER degradation enhancer 2